MTTGELRVRVEFNPDALDTVSQIKNKSAELINLTQDLSAAAPLDEKKTNEFFRLRALAMTAYEEAAMWAVKAATLK